MVGDREGGRGWEDDRVGSREERTGKEIKGKEGEQDIEQEEQKDRKEERDG